MRPPVRLLQPLEAPSLHFSKSLYVCSNCRHDVSLPSAVSQQHQFRRHAGSGSTPFTEKVRRKLWGTDNPPGLKDPYGGKGVIASQWDKRKAQLAGQEEEESAVASQEKATDVTEHFEEDEDPEALDEKNRFNQSLSLEATHAHDLKRLGFEGKWTDFPPTAGDVYHGFLSRSKATTPTQLRAAAHSVAVELAILHSLKKPLSLACDIPRHHISIYQLIEQCRITEANSVASLDNLIEFPEKEVKDNLLFVFNQLGETPEHEPEAVVEEEIVDESDQAVVEEDITYSYALKASEAPDHTGYLSFPLTDPVVKFAFVKRFSQITGHLMHDNNLNTAQNVQDIISHIENLYCKPKKLADQLAPIVDNQELANVQVMSKRYTKTNQDRDVGRLKVIEEALRERGLTSKDIKQSKFVL